jgi:hypothetical protein
MDLGKNKQLWSHTSHLLSMMHNVNCMKRDDQLMPKDFDPFYCEQKSIPMIDDLSFLADSCSRGL